MAFHITQMADFKKISLKRLTKEKSHITQKQWLRTRAELALSTELGNDSDLHCPVQSLHAGLRKQNCVPAGHNENQNPCPARLSKGPVDPPMTSTSPGGDGPVFESSLIEDISVLCFYTG